MTRHFGHMSPRSRIKIFTSCWQDADWLALSSSAQWLYITIAAAPIPRDSPDADWVALAGVVTEREVRAARAELVQSGSLVDDLGQWTHICTNRRTDPVIQRPYIPPSLRQAVYDRDGHACLTCGAMDDLTLDHIIPWSLGGEDTYENFQTLCRTCNRRKGAKV